MLQAISLVISIVAGLGVIIDRWSPSIGHLAFFKTRREARQMMAQGIHVDYAGRWRKNEGLYTMVVRDATKAELRHLGIEPEPIDPSREILGTIP